MSNIDLFLELANPDPQTGTSRWVSVTEFNGKYSCLTFGKGNSWGRSDGSLAKKYKVETRKDTSRRGHPVIAIRLNGFNTDAFFDNAISPEIKRALQDKRCVMLGVSGSSQNTKIEIDHKDGRKENMRVGDIATQRPEDFQPLCKAANDMKRQACKECKETGIRWDAKNIEGNPVSYYKGDKHYTEELGCEGCYLYDPVEYRRVTYAGRS